MLIDADKEIKKKKEKKKTTQIHFLFPYLRKFSKGKLAPMEISRNQRKHLSRCHLFIECFIV